MLESQVFSLNETPVHLGLGATVVRQERFTGDPSWYTAYGVRHAADGAEGRLVSLHTFHEPWKGWEMHPQGEELVVCIAGVIILHQEINGAVRTVRLSPGEAVVNPRGAWHTADVEGTATALFITAGAGTEGRPR